MLNVRNLLRRLYFITRNRSLLGRYGYKGFRALRQGFLPDSVTLCGIEGKNAGQYFRDSARKRVSRNTNIGCSEVLSNKLTFHRYFVDTERLPALLGVISGGQFFPEPAGTGARSLQQLLDTRTDYVVKPVLGSHGRGILFVERINQDGAMADRGRTRLNGIVLSDAALLERFRAAGDCVVSERRRNHPDLARVFPEAENSTRVTTFVDPDSGRPAVAHAYQRFGTRRSKPYEHFHLGAVAARIDVETGRLFGGRLLRADNTVVPCARHPDTDAQVDGLVLPHWHDALNQVLAIVATHPWFDYVGWDLLITGDGAVILEGNHNPGVHTAQVLEPLLGNERLKSFLAGRGILD